MARPVGAKDKVKRKDISFRPHMLFTIYDLLKVNTPVRQIAQAIGVHYQTLLDWRDGGRADVAQAFASAEKAKESNGVRQFEEYVYARLPEELQGTWNRLMDLEQGGSIEQVRDTMKDHGKRMRQHLWVHAWVHCSFNPSEACSMTGVSDKELKRWMNDDTSFADLIEAVHVHKKNMFEGALVKLVQRGETAAVIFANKTQNWDRGYGDRKEISVTGNIDNLHTVVGLDDIPISLETRKEVLAAMRRKKEDPAALPEHVEDAEYEVTPEVKVEKPKVRRVPR